MDGHSRVAARSVSDDWHSVATGRGDWRSAVAELKMGRRFWTYPRDEWEPRHRWLPYFGNDDYGRHTVVLPIPFSGYLVWAYRTCRCHDCDEMREQTARWQEEERLEGPYCHDVSFCGNRTRDPSGLCDQHRELAEVNRGE